ncbi:hypothetical protein BaRGS_00026882 [Batillaria attramentaria]|uniref:Uncharacterized protein n=1 Tax=Batillaria attramentaria TaxID=370345 RepID=A0ABD0K4K5_9CAEN
MDLGEALSVRLETSHDSLFCRWRLLLLLYFRVGFLSSTLDFISEDQVCLENSYHVQCMMPLTVLQTVTHLPALNFVFHSCPSQLFRVLVAFLCVYLVVKQLCCWWLVMVVLYQSAAVVVLFLLS